MKKIMGDGRLDELKSWSEGVHEKKNSWVRGGGRTFLGGNRRKIIATLLFMHCQSPKQVDLLFVSVFIIL